MREDLLHFIWKYQKLRLVDLVTSKNQSIQISDVGTHNHLSGPDFFNAKIEIDGQLWAGNVEVHLKSSDWYVHGHEKDANYNNVILHVVWEDDAEIFRSDNSIIPTLELKNYLAKGLLGSYQKLFDKKEKRFINCEKDLAQVDDFLFKNWLDRMFFERLERKTGHIFELLNESKNDWEHVLFLMLSKNFGLKVNGGAFLSLAQSLDFSIARKLRKDTFQLESVFFGLCHLLDDETLVDDYYVRLKREYEYQENKYALSNEGVEKPEFFKLRPPNFPTIRLSQLANLYGGNQNLFSDLIETKCLKEIYRLFDVKASEYWTDHYTFGKLSKKSPKKLTKRFIDLLVINTILPIKFCHAKYSGKEVNEQIIEIVSQIKYEDNSIVSNFRSLRSGMENAKESQAILQLYNDYCSQNRCLHCAIGNNLLNRNS